MAAVKLTKNELKKQKDALRRFQRYLPTLQLKKQQLQMELRKIEQQQRQLQEEKETLVAKASDWIAVYGEGFDLSSLLRIKEIITKRGNIAGIDIPVFEKLSFEQDLYDLVQTPLWIDAGLDFIKKVLSYDAQIKVLEVQYTKVESELRITSQRVNLFEKIKIPQTKDNIRTIQIYLGDQQTAAVVRGKISKNNLVKGGAA